MTLVVSLHKFDLLGISLTEKSRYHTDGDILMVFPLIAQHDDAMTHSMYLRLQSQTYLNSILEQKWILFVTKVTLLLGNASYIAAHPSVRYPPVHPQPNQSWWLQQDWGFDTSPIIRAPFHWFTPWDERKRWILFEALKIKSYYREEEEERGENGEMKMKQRRLME